MTEMPNSGFATEVECLANHTTGSSLHLGSHVGHPGGFRFRHRLQRVAGFAWVSYVIMLAAEELLRLARATKSEKQAQKFHGARPRKPSFTYKVLKSSFAGPPLCHGAKPRINPGSRGSRAEVEDVCSLAPPGLASLRRSRRCSKDEHRPVHDD